MSSQSKIEWVDATWNPLRGCNKVSPGCAHCYAEAFAERWRGTPGHPYEQGFDIRLVPEKIVDPLRWPKPKRVFVNSMSDIFHEQVPDKFIHDCFFVMTKAHWHLFKILTKRSERMRSFFTNNPEYSVLKNIWCGVSVENKRHGLPRLDLIQKTPVQFRFLSIEPLLEDLGRINLDGIGWVIIGGETGPRARFLQQEWVTSLIVQCRDRNVPVFFKQWASRSRSRKDFLVNGIAFREIPKYSYGRPPKTKERQKMFREALESLFHKSKLDQNSLRQLYS